MELLRHCICFFADDSYLYCKATVNEASKVCQLFQMFESASGQQVNSHKFSTFFIKDTKLETRLNICLSMGMNDAVEDCRYLALPNTLGRNKNTILGFFKEKLRRRI